MATVSLSQSVKLDAPKAHFTLGQVTLSDVPAECRKGRKISTPRWRARKL